jgi:hypothetical protein
MDKEKPLSFSSYREARHRDEDSKFSARTAVRYFLRFLPSRRNCEDFTFSVAISSQALTKIIPHTGTAIYGVLRK